MDGVSSSIQFRSGSQSINIHAHIEICVGNMGGRNHIDYQQNTPSVGRKSYLFSAQALSCWKRKISHQISLVQYIFLIPRPKAERERERKKRRRMKKKSKDES